MEEQDKIRVLKEDAVLQIRFGINFYHRMGLIMNHILQDKSPEEIVKAAENIRDKKPATEEWMVHYETMIYFLQAAEEYAEEKDLFKFLTHEEYLQYAAQFVPPETSTEEPQ